MGNYGIASKSKFTAIGDAIRYKLSESDEYTLAEMPDKIRSISGGGGAVIQSLNITANGTYSASGNVDGYSPITVAVEPDLEDITITQNGSYKSTQHDGYDDVVVNVSPDLESLSVTENGTYTSQNHDGFSTVTVNVSGSTERLLYKWNFTKNSNQTTDEIRGYVGNLSGEVSISSNGISTDGFTRFDPLLTNTALFLDGFKTRFKIKFGEFYSTSHSSGEKGRIFSFGTDMALYWNDVPMLYGSGVGGVYRLTALDNQFDLLEDDELIVDFYKDGNNYKAEWTFPDGTVINYGNLSTSLPIILGEYQYTDNGLGGVYIKGLEISLIPIQVV